MKPLADLVAPVVWTCSGLAALSFLAAAGGSRRALRAVGAAALLLGALVLVAALAHPALLPFRSAIVHPDGSTEDPRVPATLLLAAAGLLALVPAWVSLRPRPMESLGLAIPGIVLAGLLGAVANFAGLRQPMGIAGVALGALAAATGLVLAVRARAGGHAPLALQAAATGLLAIAGTLTLHGARTGGFTVAEGAAADTLGRRVVFAGAEAPSPTLRVLRVTLYGGGRDSLALRPRLRGAAGTTVVPVADARLISGPIVVPVALEERRTRPHDVQWLDRTSPLRSGDASIRLAGFRFVKGDTIRLYADLDVTLPAGVQRVSPGVCATPKGEIPFAAEARGYGPIAVAGIDADHGRVGLMLPRMSEAGLTRVATLDVRLRPALPVAWLGATLALLAFLFGLAARPAAPARG